MAIINPSRRFEGGEMANTIGGQIIRPGIRTINFKDEENKGGVYLFILPPYKLDSQGNGVWYKVIKIRDNFGLDIKEKFAIQQNCPVDWFSAKVKIYAPIYAKVETQVKDGKDMKIYPSFGRTTTRVLFNTAYFRNVNAGAHVLDIPQFGCAQHIEEWTRTKNADGTDAPLLNDYKAAIPVEFKMKKDAKGNPWQVTINNSKTYELPDQLADSDNLYNLDDVIIYPGKEELIEKLRMITPKDIFDKCMAGYSDGSTRVSLSQPVTAARNDEGGLGPLPTSTYVPPATTSVAPSFSIPKATIPQATAQAVTAAVNEMPKVSAPTGGNPIAGIDIEAARKFLKK
jgi:hypothetical protein